MGKGLMGLLAGFLFSSGILSIVIWLAAVIGYVANIVKIFHHISEPLTALMVLRMVGILAAPLGAILGFC